MHRVLESPIDRDEINLRDRDSIFGADFTKEVGHLGIEEVLSAPRSRVVKISSGSGVELEQAAESVATANGPALR